MALTGYILSENGRENIECYAAGTNGVGLLLGVVECSPNGRIISVDWALPCSTNGVSLTGFDYQMATDSTKPRADAVKTIAVENVKYGQSWKRVIVPDTYTMSDFIAACCAGCDPIPDVTVVEPILFIVAECYMAPRTPTDCVYKGAIYVPALTGGETTYTATGYGKKADGTDIVFAPTTSTGTTTTLLAADMQTNWASELGTGTFVATGQEIAFTSTLGAQVFFKIVKS